eukprot:GSChrysophyteH2.ASY1.ANO1.1499.1 assembled CDS
MSRVEETSEKDILAKCVSLREAFYAGKSLSYEWRKSQIIAIRDMCKENEDAISAALASDLGRGQFEAVALELLPLYQEVDHALSMLSTWMKPEPKDTPMGMSPSASEVHSVPFGVSLIIAPFNYPLGLCLGPLIGAVAAGNCVLIKPSELTSSVEYVMSQLVPKYLDTDCIDCIFGGIQTSQTVLAQRFDKIFFTGSTRVGKIIMKCAAENLTNITMELGGKSPCIIDKSCTNISLAVKRIMWGKYANAGQTCIAPDYILCHEDNYDELVSACQKRIQDAFGGDPSECKDYCRIVSEMHTKRLEGMLAQAATKGATILSGTGEERLLLLLLYLNPLVSAMLDFDVMNEEIFGPLLPIIKVSRADFERNIPEIVQNIHEHPLALYIFAKNRKFIDFVLARSNSGGAVVNDVVYHYANGNLPFGGIGPSGMGNAHGNYSFDCFSHKKAVMRRDDHTIFDIPQRYPPYTDFSLMLFRVNAKLPNMPHISEGAFKLAVFAGVAFLAVKGAISMNLF